MRTTGIVGGLLQVYGIARSREPSAIAQNPGADGRPEPGPRQAAEA